MFLRMFFNYRRLLLLIVCFEAFFWLLDASELLKTKYGATVAVASAMSLWKLLFLSLFVTLLRIIDFLNLNLAQCLFDFCHSFAVLLNQRHLLEFQDFIFIGLCRDFFLLLLVGLLEWAHLLLKVILLDLVLQFVVFSLLDLTLAIGFERVYLISDCLFECVSPFAFSSFLSYESFINFLLMGQCVLDKWLNDMVTLSGFCDLE